MKRKVIVELLPSYQIKQFLQVFAVFSGDVVFLIILFCKLQERYLNLYLKKLNIFFKKLNIFYLNSSPIDCMLLSCHVCILE